MILKDIPEGQVDMTHDYSRIAIVTGATSGIGEATARTFMKAGFGVVGSGRNADTLKAIKKELGPAFCGVAGDAADDSVVERFFASAQECFRRTPDIVVVNAGRGLGGSVTEVDLQRFDDIVSINVGGALALMQKSARKMVDAQQGVFPKAAADIVVIGSIGGRHITPFSAGYGATKAAVHSLTEGLRREVGPKGVRVTLVEPGAVVSGFQAAAGYSDELVGTLNDKFGPLLNPADVADVIYFVVTQAPHVNICDIVIRPTRQDYP